MAWRPIVALASLILVVAACGDQTADTSSTTAAPSPTSTGAAASSTTTSTTSSTTTTTTTVPIVIGPGDPLTTVGLGPIRIGMSVADAEAVSGVMLIGEPEPAVSENCYFVVPEDAAGLDGVSFLILDERIGSVYISDPSEVTTKSGAGLGTTEEQLEDLFGAQLEDAGDFINDGKGWMFVPQDEQDAEYRVIFEMDENDTVAQIRAGILPAVGFGEGCL